MHSIPDNWMLALRQYRRRRRLGFLGQREDQSANGFSIRDPARAQMPRSPHPVECRCSARDALRRQQCAGAGLNVCDLGIEKPDDDDESGWEQCLQPSLPAFSMCFRCSKHINLPVVDMIASIGEILTPWGLWIVTQDKYVAEWTPLLHPGRITDCKLSKAANKKQVGAATWSDLCNAVRQGLAPDVVYQANIVTETLTCGIYFKFEFDDDKIIAHASGGSIIILCLLCLAKVYPTHIVYYSADGHAPPVEAQAVKTLELDQARERMEAATREFQERRNEFRIASSLDSAQAASMETANDVLEAKRWATASRF